MNNILEVAEYQQKNRHVGDNGHGKLMKRESSRIDAVGEKLLRLGPELRKDDRVHQGT